MKAIYLVVLASAVFWLGSLQPLQAQAVSNAEIHGVVTDPSGAVIAGAQIKATQSETGQMRTTVSNTDGSYVLPNLPVGPYSLEVSSQAFGGYVQSGIILQVGNNVQINISLQVGAVTQQLQVSANAAMVETQDTSISEVMDQRRIIDLPLNGRQATDLIVLSGGRCRSPELEAAWRKGQPVTTTSAPPPSPSREAKSTATTTCWMAGTITTPLTT